MLSRNHRPLLACVAALAFSVATASFSAAQASTPAKKPAPQASSSKAPAKKTTTRRSRRPRAQTAPTADRIREIQASLGRAGFYTKEPTGKWDASTTQAMKGFQEANGLKATGKLDALSLQKLGLGSNTAGVAPPRPVASASSSSPQGR